MNTFMWTHLWVVDAHDYITASMRVSTYVAKCMYVCINTSVKDENSSLKQKSREI